MRVFNGMSSVDQEDGREAGIASLKRWSIAAYRRACQEKRVEDFCIELAEVPARIRCRFADSKRFLRQYISEREPLFTVEPTAEDLQRTQAGFDRMDEAEGIPPRQRTEEYLEKNALHSLLAEKLTAYKVLLMHGSALCMDGQAYIFTAPSGTGKSTHARLWREAFGDRVWMINDDKPLLRIENEGVRVYGSPWDGKHHLSRNDSAPLKAIVSLHRGKTNHIEPMSQADAFMALLPQKYRSKDQDVARRVIALQTALLDKAAFYRIYCNMEPEAAQVAWKGMNSP